MWVIAGVGIVALSIWLLIKEGLPTKRLILIGLALAGAVTITSPFGAVVTFPAFLAGVGILKKVESNFRLLKPPVWKSVLLAVLVGLILGVINLLPAGLPIADAKPFI